MLAALGDFASDVGIREMGARHPDHVELAALDGVARCRHVLDPRCVEGRHPRRGPHLAGKIEMRRRARAHAGDDMGERLLGVDMAANDVDEIDQAGGGEALRDRNALLAREAALPVLVADHPRADEEAVADPLADGREDLEAEAHAVFERPAIVVVAPVGGWRPELVDQVPVAFELEAIEARGFDPLGAVGVRRDDAGDVPVLHDLGEGAVRRLAHVGRRYHRQPVRLVPVGPPAEMGHLDHYRRAMGVHVVREFGEPADDLVLVEEDVAEGLRAVGGDHGGAADHGQRDAAFRLFRVVEPVALLRHAVFGIGRLMRGRHQAVAKMKVLEPVWLHQRIVRHDLSHPPDSRLPPHQTAIAATLSKTISGLTIKALPA